jgi:hypothetical protein
MVMLTARVLLGSLFAVAALAKLADKGGARRAVEAFGVPRPFVALVGSAMIATEFSIAALLLAVPGSMGTRYGSVLALIVLMVFSTAVLVNLARGRRLECRCFGRLSSGPLGWSAIARNGCFATLASFVALSGRFAWPLAAFAIVMLGLWIGPAASRRWTTRAGATAAGLALPDGAGQIQTLESLRVARRPLVLIFSQPGCQACDALLPEVAQWQHDLDERVTVALINGGSAGDSVPLELVDVRRASFTAYGITATPSAVLIGGDGVLVTSPARGAGAIRDLVERAVQISAEARFTRRGLLRRGSVGLASASMLPAVAARAPITKSAT